MNRDQIKEFNKKGYQSVAARYAKEAEALLVLAEKENRELRLKYSGAIGLLCTVAVYLPESQNDNHEMIWKAVNDWCDITGWNCKQVLKRIEVFPPKTINEAK